MAMYNWTPFNYNYVDAWSPCIDWPEGAKHAVKDADILVLSLLPLRDLSLKKEGVIGFLHQLKGL